MCLIDVLKPKDNHALRSMNPDVIVTDELGGEEDAAVAASFVRGVKVLATCHGEN